LLTLFTRLNFTRLTRFNFTRLDFRRRLLGGNWFSRFSGFGRRRFRGSGGPLASP
jgi:hypothetical protein